MVFRNLVVVACVLSLLPAVILGADSDECDCGVGSKKCKIENDTKVCTCKYLYREENGFCKAYCEEDWHCDNGAECVNATCKCLRGTSGDFCDIIDECVGTKGPVKCGDPDDVFCDFNPKTLRTYCHCRIFEYMYYAKERTCIECDCGDLGSCYLRDGKKTCVCNEGSVAGRVYYHGGKEERCTECKCGNLSTGCSFDDRVICHCPEGFAQKSEFYSLGYTCEKCDCGPHGSCYFSGYSRYCNCNEGYSSFLNKERTDVTCKACDCGTNGTCYFSKEEKICSCNNGYADRDGICADIDECSQENSCPDTTDCRNTMGSYECVCKEGYASLGPGSDPKVDGCEGP